jgi:hypothetical protein
MCSRADDTPVGAVIERANDPMSGPTPTRSSGPMTFERTRRYASEASLMAWERTSSAFAGPDEGVAAFGPCVE